MFYTTQTDIDTTTLIDVVTHLPIVHVNGKTTKDAYPLKDLGIFEHFSKENSFVVYTKTYIYLALLFDFFSKSSTQVNSKIPTEPFQNWVH